jgi:hypothetical protein
MECESEHGRPPKEQATNVAVAKDILRYFLRNPQAVESLTEIARWRLMQEQIRRTVEETQLALAWLIAEGYVQEEVHLGTARLFHLNPTRREDAEMFLQQGTGKTDPEPRSS